LNKAVGEKHKELRKTRGMELENILHELIPITFVK